MKLFKTKTSYTKRLMQAGPLPAGKKTKLNKTDKVIEIKGVSELWWRCDV